MNRCFLCGKYVWFWHERIITSSYDSMNNNILLHYHLPCALVETELCHRCLHHQRLTSLFKTKKDLKCECNCHLD